MIIRVIDSGGNECTISEGNGGNNSVMVVLISLNY